MTATETRLAQLLDLAEQARRHALTGAYEPIAERARAVAEELEPAARQLLASGRAADAMAMITGLHTFWQDTGRADIGQALAEAALGSAGEDGVEPSLRARTMLTAGEMAFRQGEQQAARAWSESAVAVATAAGDLVTAALAEVSLARVAFREGDAVQIEAHARRGLDLAGSDQKVQRAAFHMLAWAAHAADDRPLALDWFERSLAVRRAMNDPVGIAVELANLGDMAMEAGEHERAAAHLADALVTAARLENVYLLTSLVASAGMLAGATGRTEEAAMLLAAADAAYSSTSLVPDPGTRELMDAAAGNARALLTPERAATAQERGRGLSLSEAGSRAIELCASRRGLDGRPELTSDQPS